MPAYNTEPGAKLLGQFRTPFKGVNNILAPHLLPQDALYSGLNLTIHRGALHSRRGFISTAAGAVYTNASLDTAAVMGCSTEPGPDASTRRLLAFTRSRVFRSDNNGAWSEITNGIGLGNQNYQLFTTPIYQVGQTPPQTTIVATPSIPLRRIIRGANLDTITASVGSVPTFASVTTSFGRIVGCPFTFNGSNPYIQWSEAYDYTNWPATNFAYVADTPDVLIGVKSIGTLGLVIYKDNSIYTAYGQSGPSSSAFRIEYKGRFEGPMTMANVVEAEGVHYYMTNTGRIGRFDGTSHQWICQGLREYLNSDISPVLSFGPAASGCYNRQANEIYFFYRSRTYDAPTNGYLEYPQGVVVVKLPYPEAGINDYTGFVGYTNSYTTVAGETDFWDGYANAVVYITQLDSGTYKSYACTAGITNYQDGLTGSANDYTCSFQTGLIRTPDGTLFEPSIELLSRRDDTRGLTTINSITANHLEVEAGTTGQSISVDLTKTWPKETIGFIEQGSYFGLKASWTASSKFEYLGADVYGRNSG